MIANAQSEIQIVDTHESLETLINVDVAAGTAQFNRTLVISFMYVIFRSTTTGGDRRQFNQHRLGAYAGEPLEICTGKQEGIRTAIDFVDAIHLHATEEMDPVFHAQLMTQFCQFITVCLDGSFPDMKKMNIHVGSLFQDASRCPDKGNQVLLRADATDCEHDSAVRRDTRQGYKCFFCFRPRCQRMRDGET